jgi:hypothetical protein
VFRFRVCGRVRGKETFYCKACSSRIVSGILTCFFAVAVGLEPFFLELTGVLWNF